MIQIMRNLIKMLKKEKLVKKEVIGIIWIVMMMNMRLFVSFNYNFLNFRQNV